jgi:hypothetical protein
VQGYVEYINGHEGEIREELAQLKKIVDQEDWMAVVDWFSKKAGWFSRINEEEIRNASPKAEQFVSEFEEQKARYESFKAEVVVSIVEIGKKKMDEYYAWRGFIQDRSAGRWVWPAIRDAAARHGITSDFANQIATEQARTIKDRFSSYAGDLEKEKIERCGPNPKDSTEAVVGYLRGTANDPESVQVEGCLLLRAEANKCWGQSCRFRERNKLGALVYRRGDFYVKKGEVIKSGEIEDIGERK